MSDRSSLIPTAVAGGYGAAPHAAPKKGKAAGTSVRVLAAVAGVAACGGLAAHASGAAPDLFASLGASKHAALSVEDAAHAKTLASFAEMTKKYGDTRAALASAHAEAVQAMRHMTVRPKANTPNARPRLGASDYENCVAKGSRASAKYEAAFGNATDGEKEMQIKKDLVFDVNRADMPAITAYNDSKALLMSVGCEVPPPPTFQELQLCVDEDTKACCDKSCSMPLPAHCDPESGKSFGTCAPAVFDLCDEIKESRDKCVELKQHVTAKEAAYDAMEVGHLTCRTSPDAPFAKAAYAQVKYEEAYTAWVDATNDATEVCTIGHALWVHNLGLFQSHYEQIRATTDDIIEMCDLSKDPDSKLDMTDVIEETASGFYSNSATIEENAPEVVKEAVGDPGGANPTEDKQILVDDTHGGHGVKIVSDSDVGNGFDADQIQDDDKRRKLVWWQQLCDPTIAAMEDLLTTLEIATPQLQCFAETCQHKQKAEKKAFDDLVKAYDVFVVGYAKYQDETNTYNAGVVEKNTALATVVAAYETFHPVKDQIAILYDKDVAKFEAFDAGDRSVMRGCGLTDCQVQAICSEQISEDKTFEKLVDVESCSANPAPTAACKVEKKKTE